MCDPISMIRLAFSIGSAVANYSAQEDMANQQNAANDAWVAYQQRQSREYQARDEQQRQQAEAARTSALGELSATKQKQAQGNEAARLTTALTPDEISAMAKGSKPAIDARLLSGQQGGDPGIQTSIEAQIQQAAQEARARIAALAQVQSYGGSQFGMTNRANTIFNTAGQDIRLASDERQGDLAAYNVAKAVEPIKIVQHGGQSLGAIAGAGAQAAGKGLGSAMASSLGGSFGA
jgi:hypothetical protein